MLSETALFLPILSALALTLQKFRTTRSAPVPLMTWTLGQSRCRVWTDDERLGLTRPIMRQLTGWLLTALWTPLNKWSLKVLLMALTRVIPLLVIRHVPHEILRGSD